MKLTVEEYPERIKRYLHIRPAPLWGPPRCGVRCPGIPNRCTLQRGHRGPHVAHGLFRRVVAVWDGEVKTKRPELRIGISRTLAGPEAIVGM